MLKFQFLLYHKESESFLSDIMNLGVVHIIDKGVVSNELAKQLEYEIKESKIALGHLINRKKNAKTKPTDNIELPPANVLIEKEHQIEDLQHKLDKIETEIAIMEPWGEFSWADIHTLEEKAGIRLRFFQYPEKKFKKKWSKVSPLQIVNRKAGTVYFTLIQDNDASYELPSVPISLPKQSLSELKSRKKTVMALLDQLNEELDTYAIACRKDLKFKIDETTDTLNFHGATQEVERLVDEKVHLLEGWVPVSDAETLRKYLLEKKVVFLEQEAAEKDLPPILLKNNRFAKLFEPIGNLFSLPNYGELDLTIFFAPFFFLFFGFCLGDAGYGFVLFTGATLIRLFSSSKKITGYLALMQLFGIATTIVGFISGTLFGLEMANLSAFDEISHLFLTQNQLFNIALVIGFVQILFALAINAYRSYLFNGIWHSISKVGWIILMLSLADWYVLEQLKEVSRYSMWLGVGCIVLFGAPSKGVLRSLGYGVADLYNITGMMGDLLSYIRLFALGVSSAILGLVVNNIAMELKNIPYIGMVLFIVILVVGHSANIALASLSAFVHPMRLTFVEFYKNAGFLGGGKPFQPLIKLSKNK